MPSLQVLNLQANRISDLKQVKKLGELPKLKKLSLFGNPIEEKKHYRSYVITVCPLVGQLDFSVVTNQERDTAAGWAFTAGQLNPEEKGEKHSIPRLGVGGCATVSKWRGSTRPPALGVRVHVLYSRE